MTTDVRIVMAGDSALIAEFEERIDEATNRRARSVAAAIDARRFDGVLDVVPTFRSVAVYFDPLRADVDTLRRTLQDAAAADAANPLVDGRGRTHEIPVQYGGDNGPDLSAVAERALLSEAEVIERHAGRDYQVFMLGFMPGFAYLGVVDEAIALPRLETPRTKVRAGSVAIAGRLTAVYPGDMPGGWRILGTTAVRPFDLSRDDPFMFAPGDRVRFVPV